jgi:hypothetical protein
MPTTSSNAEQAFLRYIALRVAEAEAALRAPLAVTYDFGDYTHFETPRGFGVTFFSEGRCHMRYSRKAFRHDISRFDGVLKHELGHVIDMLFDPLLVDAWASARGVDLAKSAERRADDIAHAVWGRPLRYDEDTVQNSKRGRVGRPAHLPQ